MTTARGLAMVGTLLAVGSIAWGISTGGASESSDVVKLPPSGETTMARLSDGTPVWLVHHPDDSTTVLAIDVLATEARLRPEAVSGLREQVLWLAGSRRFVPASQTLAAGAYDEYGRASEPWMVQDLDHYRHEDAGNGTVAVGERVSGASHETTARLPMSDPRFPQYHLNAVRPFQPLRDSDSGISIDEALAQPDGSVVLVDMDLVVTGPDSTLVCIADRDDGSCVGTSAVPRDVQMRLPPGGREVWRGPLLARVTDGSFSQVTLTGALGSGGVRGYDA